MWKAAKRHLWSVSRKDNLALEWMTAEICWGNLFFPQQLMSAALFIQALWFRLYSLKALQLQRSTHPPNIGDERRKNKEGGYRVVCSWAIVVQYDASYWHPIHCSHRGLWKVVCILSIPAGWVDNLVPWCRKSITGEPRMVFTPSYGSLTPSRLWR